MSSIFSELRAKRGPKVKSPMQLRTEKLKSIGVINPQENINRSTMLSQVEAFHTHHKLNPLKPEQRYIVSPHDDIGNLYANTVGMSSWGMERGLSAIRPVFKDENQRTAFHRKLVMDLATSKARGETNTHRYNALQQLGDWSSKDSAMTDFSSVDTKRSHPIVYTQGHGMPGDTNIYSNTHQRVSANRVAKMLHKMKLPKLSEVRANSCFSGTQHQIRSTHSTRRHFKEQSMEFHDAGSWSQTFAGKLQRKLRSFMGRKNRVAGYMGPTGQTPEWVRRIVLGGSVQQRRGMATDIGRDPHLRSQMRRRDPSVKG